MASSVSVTVARWKAAGILPMALMALSAGCASAPRLPEPPPPQPVGNRQPPPFVDAGDRITPDPGPDEVHALTAPLVLSVMEGEATYYADKFDGRRTASGVVFRNSESYAAHRTFPFGTVVRVTNLRNDKSVILKVVDRGPFGSAKRIIDVSQAAARELDFIARGVTQVRVEVLEWGQSPGNRGK